MTFFYFIDIQFGNIGYIDFSSELFSIHTKVRWNGRRVHNI